MLAVVSLHQYTFKPHGNTKTSIVFLQKWNDNSNVGPLCPRQDDYPVFFAISRRGGKDSKGDYVYLEDEYGMPLLDEYGHMIVSHDLDGIADAFLDFGRKNELTYCRETK